MDHDHDHHHHHDHDHDHDHLNASSGPFKAMAQQDLIMAKVVAMVVLGFVSFFIGVLPVKLASWFHFGDDILSGKKKRAHELVISLLLCFGGGVLLYTTFVHLQPEVKQGFDALRQAGKLPAEDMHLAELTFCAGFFLVYIVEELVHLLLDGRSAHDDGKEVVVVHRTMSLRRCPARMDGASLEAGHAHHNNQHHHHHHLHHHHGSNIGGPNQMIPRAILAPGVPTKPEAPQIHTVDGAVHASTRKSMTSSTEGLINGSHLGSTASFQTPADCHSHTSHGKEVVPTSIRGFLTVLALSFHAVFEGLAVGLESSPSNVWYLFGAIATHKFVIAFCVGVELVTSKTKLSLLLLYVATFAVVSPIGIAAGLLLGHDQAAGEGMAAVVLQGMAAGTLLYVVFFEILQRERTNTQCGVFQLLAIMTGFGVMLALQMTSTHSHSHGPHGQDHDHDHDHHDHEDDRPATTAPLAAALHVAEALASRIAR